MRRVSTIKEIIASFLQLTFIKRKEEAASIADDMALIAIEQDLDKINIRLMIDLSMIELRAITAYRKRIKRMTKKINHMCFIRLRAI